MHAYERGLKWVFAHQLATLLLTLATVATIVGAIGLYRLASWGFFLLAAVGPGSLALFGGQPSGIWALLP